MCTENDFTEGILIIELNKCSKIYDYQKKPILYSNINLFF